MYLVISYDWAIPHSSFAYTVNYGIIETEETKVLIYFSTPKAYFHASSGHCWIRLHETDSKEVSSRALIPGVPPVSFVNHDYIKLV